MIILDEELLFRILVVSIYAIFATIRVAFRIPASRRVEKKKYEPSRIVTSILSIGILGYFVTLILYLFYLPLVLWFSITLSSTVRWLSVIISFMCIPLLYWIHSTLDKQYAAILAIQEDHALIETGPYRKVRHPMYTIFIIFSIGIALITSNLAIIVFSLILSSSFPSIAKTEELMLIDSFGDEYRSYMDRTGRFFPPLKLKA